MKKHSLLLIFILMFSFVLFGCHSHNYETTVVEPTCEEAGYTIYTCECGKTYNADEVPATGHHYETEVVEPTCEEAGYTVYTCACGDTYNADEVPATGHNYETEVVEPTCTEEGYTVYTCECGHTYNGDKVPAMGHDYQKETVKPTCTEAGYIVYTCECGDTYTEEGEPAKGHTYTNDITEPTCTEPGKKVQTCACGDVVEETIPATGHSYATSVVEPTCDVDGYTKHTCACGDTYNDTPVPATGHKLAEDWKTVKEPTYEEKGLREKACTVKGCSYKETEEIDMLDDSNLSEYKVVYELNGGHFQGGYTSTEEIGELFLADFNKYGDGSVVTKEGFQTESHPCVKTSLANAEMLAKWNWLWVYMLDHLQAVNPTATSSYLVDTYPILRKMIAGDTAAINESANARTSIRSYIHGLLNNMKGCGDLNLEFSKFSPDFSKLEEREEFLKHQYNLTVTLEKGATLQVPVREGYEFLGWKDKRGNIVTTASSYGKVEAQWEEKVPVESIEITNKVTTIDLYETYQIEYTINPEDAVNKYVKFSSSNEEVATVDENGFITTHKVGEATITILSLSSTAKSDTMTFEVVTPGYFDISYDSTSYVVIGEDIKLNAKYINSDNQEVAVTWSSVDPTIATVDANGNVVGVKEGLATIRATVVGDETEYQDFIVTVITNETFDALEFILSSHESNVHVQYELPVGAGTPSYYADIVGSVSKLLYNDELVLDLTYNKATNDKYGTDLEGRRMESIEFITVHYTGNMNKGADAEANAEWFAQPLSSNNTSIHYVTGNDGVFKGLDEQYRAAHAGDDGSSSTVAKFEWRDTPVEVLPTDPKFPVVTITKDATFAINGRDTFIKVPEETKFGRGFVTDSKWLNNMGLGVNVKDGKYQLGTAWWCYTQIGEGRICSNGGNKNSIGIESAVNLGSDLWYTWQKTAQLVADIMVRNNLDITKVKGHHMFSAKDCPQPMLEEEMQLWWEFIELVETEYEKITEYKDVEFTFESDSEYLDDNGRVLKQGLTSQVVTYTVTVKDGSSTKTIELASIIEGTYNK